MNIIFSYYRDLYKLYYAKLWLCKRVISRVYCHIWTECKFNNIVWRYIRDYIYRGRFKLDDRFCAVLCGLGFFARIWGWGLTVSASVTTQPSRQSHYVQRYGNNLWYLITIFGCVVNCWCIIEISPVFSRCVYLDKSIFFDDLNELQ